MRNILKNPIKIMVNFDNKAPSALHRIEMRNFIRLEQRKKLDGLGEHHPQPWLVRLKDSHRSKNRRLAPIRTA